MSPTAYPAGSGAQLCADWCASTLAAQASIADGQATAAVALQTWVMQRQWLDDGGGMAPYPLPIASGPAIALPLSGDASSIANAPGVPSVSFS